MKKIQTRIWVLLLLLSILTSTAQDVDSTAVQITDSVGVKVEEKTQIFPKESAIKPLVITGSNANDENRKLKDLEEAYRYDSLWIDELYKNTSHFDEMHAALNEKDSLTNYIVELPTDTLKARLERLNQTF